MKRFCMALDLVDDPEMISQYQRYHQKIWPEVADNIRQRGVIDMQIWQVENRLFMVMDVVDTFNSQDAERIAERDETNRQWEALMSQFQKPLPSARAGEKWIDMVKIFDLSQA
ncbi:L-rhamnose mutarotase [Bartonella sp. LJL80]